MMEAWRVPLPHVLHRRQGDLQVGRRIGILSLPDGGVYEGQQ